MRTPLLFCCVILSATLATSAAGQAPARPPAPAPAPAGPAQPAPTPAPAAPAPAARRPAPAAPAVAARTGMTITVTNSSGATLPGVQVRLMGPSDRSGETDPSGQLRFTGMQVGTYRLRCSG